MGTHLPPKDTEQISEASTPALFAGLIHDARELAIGHVERMRGEISDEFKNLKAMMRNVAIAVAVLVIGAVLAGHFVAIALIALGLPPWAGYGLAAAIAIATGIIVIKRLPENKQDADLFPEESLASLKRDMSDVSHSVRK